MELPFNVEDVEAIGAAGRWYQLKPRTLEVRGAWLVFETTGAEAGVPFAVPMSSVEMLRSRKKDLSFQAFQDRR
jgi:hypothetical protein